MRSLTHRLVVTSCIAIGIVGIVSAILTYSRAQQEAEALLDYQMQQVARYMGVQNSLSTDPDPLHPSLDPHHDREDTLLVTVRDAGDRVLFAAPYSTPLPSGGGLGFGMQMIGKDQYRLYRAANSNRTVTVAQSLEMRRETAIATALAALIPNLVLIPVLVLVIALVIRVELRSLTRAAAEVSTRPPFALDQLPTRGMPREILPLVEEINRLLARLQIAVTREQQFITDAAHALRTPLTALRLQAEVLDGAQTPREQTERRNELESGIERMTRLTEQLLVLARSDGIARPEDAAATIRGLDTDLDGALAEIAAHYAAAAASRRIDLRLETGSGALVDVDHRTLLLIFGNLLDNALRYTSEGGSVRIISLLKESLATVCVIDEGPGLPAEELNKVFERFYRVPGDPMSGNGLGLATVQALLNQCGGRISLENRQGRGPVASPAGNRAPGGLLARVSLPC